MVLDFGAWDVGVLEMYMIAAGYILDFPGRMMFVVEVDLQVMPALLL